MFYRTTNGEWKSKQEKRAANEHILLYGNWTENFFESVVFLLSLMYNKIEYNMRYTSIYIDTIVYSNK
jgi:hypothetical protein